MLPVIDAVPVVFPVTLLEAPMSKDQIRIELTDDQKAQVRKATGKEAEAVELTVDELEDRIAPSTLNIKGTKKTPMGHGHIG